MVTLDARCPRPLERNYLDSGPERFVAAGSDVRVRPMNGRMTSALDDFRAMGNSGSRAGRVRLAGQPPAGSEASQADLTIAENTFPNSQPALAGRTNELMLLYVSDPGTAPDLQRTDIKWTRWDGTNWSEPKPILQDTRAEFGPQVEFDGNGDAIAVWERVADTNFTQLDLTALAAQMEIVWSRWDRAAGSWTEPAGLTANTLLDHAPLLCGPMADGSVLAAWTRNESNLLMGTNGAGSQVFWAQWKPAAHNWSAEQTLLADLPYRLSQSLAGVSNRAVYAWTRDLGGTLTNAADQQVFYCQWTNGAWKPPMQFTADALGNRNARVAVAPGGDVFLTWQQGTNLVLSTNFSTNPTLVRADSTTAGFADYAMTVGPAGNLVLLWQEMSANGSDAHYAVFDPASGTWSQDALLTQDAPLERSFASVWDNVGNLTVAYNKVEIIKTNKTVSLEGGQIVTITNVPQPGRVDLVVTKRALIKDVALLAGDFTVEGVNYLPGDPLTLTAKVRNTGNLAVSNGVLAFYDGNPQAGGVAIANLAGSGWLEGGASVAMSNVWVVPEPAAPHTLFAVVNPGSTIAEWPGFETNNTQSVKIGGTDLAVSLLSRSAETNGAVRVIAQVQNLGTPAAVESVLAIRRAGQTNAPLASAQVPALEPGRLSQVALDLPSGTQPEGEALYRLMADDAHVLADVDTNNNTTTFAVNLWVDSDKDGMPDSWERDHGFDPSDPTDAAQDKDSDGMTNLAEFRAGTAPADPYSYLRIESLVVGGEAAGVEVRWGSTANHLYTVERSVAVPGGFTPVTEHVLSTPPENIWVDRGATNAKTHFYRLKVE